MTIRIGETHVLLAGGAGPSGKPMFVVPGDAKATEAVKRLVEAMKEIETAAEFFVQHGISSDALRGGHFQTLDKARAALAPFTDTDASLVDSGLRSCATPENEETGT